MVMNTKFESQMSEIGSEFSRLISSCIPISLVYGEVISVNSDENTFDISTTDDNEIRDIPLTGVKNATTSILIKPSIGSVVVVGFVENDPSMSFPVLFTQIDSADITVGESTISVNSNKVIFNGGDSPLIYIEQLTEKLNEFIDKYNNHTHKIPMNSVITSAQGGILNTTPIELLKTENTANDFSEGDYSDEKILH